MTAAGHSRLETTSAMNDKPSRWSGLREILRYVPRFRDRVFVIAIEAFALGIGLHLLARGMRRRGFLRRFATMGASITATVTKATTVTVGGYGRVVMLEYTYDDAEGRTRKGRSPYMYPAEADRYPVGSPVRIVIDPNRPGESYLPPGPIGEG